MVSWPRGVPAPRGLPCVSPARTPVHPRAHRGDGSPSHEGCAGRERRWQDPFARRPRAATVAGARGAVTRLGGAPRYDLRGGPLGGDGPRGTAGRAHVRVRSALESAGVGARHLAEGTPACPSRRSRSCGTSQRSPHRRFPSLGEPTSPDSLAPAHGLRLLHRSGSVLMFV